MSIVGRVKDFLKKRSKELKRRRRIQGRLNAEKRGVRQGLYRTAMPMICGGCRLPCRRFIVQVQKEDNKIKAHVCVQCARKAWEYSGKAKVKRG